MFRAIIRQVLAIVLLVLAPCVGTAQGQAVLRLYLDADMSGAHLAGKAIEQGVRTALAEAGNQVDKRPVELVVLDHRGNTARSRAHLEQILKDPQALAVFAGLHSPPVISNLSFINENEILLLDPWAAAGPITRYADGPNWIFRLSVDDSKVGHVIVRRAVEERGLLKLALLLENTGWGKSNLEVVSRALLEWGLEPATVQWFDWGLGPAGASILVRNVRESGADAIYLVSNTPEGVELIRAMLELGPAYHLPIISHWGITGGSFWSGVGKDMQGVLDLEFIQTSFSFLSPDQPELAQQALETARSLFPEIRASEDIKAPTGFIHAYDLTRILIQAAQQAGLDGPMPDARKRLKTALENLEMTVPGLVKDYTRPFRAFSPGDPDAHEALGIEELVFGRFDKEGNVVLDGVE